MTTLTLTPMSPGDLTISGDIALGTAGNYTVESDSDASGAGDIIFKTAGSTRAKIHSEGYVEILKDSSSLNYAGTHAAVVVQQRDTASLGSLEVVPGMMFQFNASGNGVVVAASNSSYSVWAGAWSTMVKSGDGSGHCWTATGELHDVGVGGYNEIGGFQGEFTNVSSTKGCLSGVEVVVKDSPDSGTTHFDTMMTGVGSRVAKFDSGRTNKWTTNFLASSEGTVAPDSIMRVNDSGFQQWVTGIDLTSATFTSGIAMKFKNNVNLSWLDTSGSLTPVILVDASDVTSIRPTKASGFVKLGNFAGTRGISIDGTTGQLVADSTSGTKTALFKDAGTTRLEVQSDGTLNFVNSAGVTTTAVGAAGGASALPATPLGYLWVYIGGSARRIPYYN